MSRRESPTTSIEKLDSSQDKPETFAEIVDEQPRTVEDQLQDFRNILQDFGSRTLNTITTCEAEKLYEGPPKCDCCINWVAEYPSDLKPEIEGGQHGRELPLVLRYAKSHKKAGNSPLTLHSIVVQSEFLKSVASTVLKSYPGIDAGVEDLEFEAPFEPFFHRWPELELERHRHNNDLAKSQELELLHNVLRTELERDMKAAQDLTGHGNITFDLLWTLYPPGSVAFGNFANQDQCFLVVRSSYEAVRGTENEAVRDTESFVIELAFLDFNGTRFGWIDTSKQVLQFKDTRKIAELSVIPQKYHTHLYDTTDRLCKLGERVAELSKGGYKMYKGIAELQLTSFSFEDSLSDLERYVEGRIIVDPKGYQQNVRTVSIVVDSYPTGLRALVPHKEGAMTEHRRPRPNTKSNRHTHVEHSDSSDPEPEFEYVITERHNKHHHGKRERSRSVDSYIMPDTVPQGPNAAPLDNQAWVKEVFDMSPEIFCRPVVRGYCLQSRHWAEFQVADVTDIEWNEHAFDRLVMSASRKRLLQALVEEQRNHKADLDDIVQGKGQGLIILLSGPPGTGKTLTAESIADRLRMPLYMLGATQLGDRLCDIENELSRILRLAASWDAVLLLDEADAFLETRSDESGSRERNKPFLRVLEYYQGVLILTTNRSVTFDPAFYSRIHLTLRFKPLDHDSRKAVWSNFLQPTGTTFTDTLLTELAGEILNGRQIKNIVKMARLLAQNDGKDLSIGHIREVIDVVQEDFGDHEPF
ncbi:P-loop containing nucleoside triphosphate hydrolase protein [Polychaeton citri CBS 116435]|uniref:P-loop containing nucleoside triphosphate hydrolase protein n=1 Tax=Polychaeton citri CBS 116435 TaxID=1314669 RepID=A0A9P4QGG2_9PEZI|nr:P-loop containing nucleoside triphosphate hydrolase protein [Polychaeton citri CBS 116435]